MLSTWRHVHTGTKRANVIIGDLNTKAATTLAEDIQNHAAPDQPGSAIVGPETSVTNWEDQLKLFDFVEKKFGKIDVVVSCAGVTEFSKPSFEIDELDGTACSPHPREFERGFTFRERALMESCTNIPHLDHSQEWDD